MAKLVPVPAEGSHENFSPDGGACIMEMVDYVYNPNGDEVLTDTPQCTSKFIAHLAAGVNDALEEGERYLIMRDFDRLFGTAGNDNSAFHEALEEMLKSEYRKAVERSEDRESYVGNAEDWLEHNRWSSTYFYRLVEGLCELIDEEAPDYRDDARTLVDPRALAKAQLLTNALDIYDEMFGPREVVEQDLSVFSKNFGFVEVELKF